MIIYMIKWEGKGGLVGSREGYNYLFLGVTVK